jgi:hypothetical protein
MPTGKKFARQSRAAYAELNVPALVRHAGVRLSRARSGGPGRRRLSRSTDD